MCSPRTRDGCSGTRLTGALGGSLWLLLINLFAFRLVSAYRPRSPRFLSGGFGHHRPALLVIPLAGSALRWATYVPQGVPLEVVVVQPNVDPYTEKFGGVDPMQQLDRMLAQAEAVMTDTTVLVVMPETALQERTVLQRGPNSDLVAVGLWENDLGAARSVQRIQAFIAKHPRVAVLSRHVFVVSLRT